jgi:hypothetical protein
VLLVRAILHDGTVAMEFMTDSAVEADGLRQLWLEFESVRGVVVLDEPGWVRL